MLSHLKSTAAPALMLCGVLAGALSQEVQAADKFKVTAVACEMFWYSKHTPTISYDIVDERRADYNTNPSADYFRQAARRTRDYCDRTSNLPQTFGAPRRIIGVWFASTDGQFKALYNLDNDGIDLGAGIVNQIGDRYTAEQRHKAQLEEIKTHDLRAQQVRQAQEQAARARVDAQNAREQAFLSRKDLQLARLGTEVMQANFAQVDNVRTNPFHFKKLGLAVVRTQFNKMVSERLAMFGSELAPIFLRIEDADRFTRSGETVMLAFKVQQRGDVERSYGSLPEIVVSMLKADPIFGDYVGAYSCPANDCGHLLDVPPPS